jgi:hypothetical protein
MKFIAFLFLLIPTFHAHAQQIVNHEVEPVGVYTEINMKSDTKICMQLLDSTNRNRLTLIDSVEDNPNVYTPPVLYVLSAALFLIKKFDDAAFWFYVAQLRARYDVNRCADRTANATQYNQTFGPSINQYALQNLDNLELIVKKVVEFVRVNDEKYDQRWINLSGMDAMIAGLGGKK